MIMCCLTSILSVVQLISSEDVRQECQDGAIHLDQGLSV